VGSGDDCGSADRLRDGLAAAFADASRISLPALRHEFAVPLRLLGIGLPLTIVAGALMGATVVALLRTSSGPAAERRGWSQLVTPRQQPGLPS
jgi:hypothetical protein